MLLDWANSRLFQDSIFKPKEDVSDMSEEKEKGKCYGHIHIEPGSFRGFMIGKWSVQLGFLPPSLSLFLSLSLSLCLCLSVYIINEALFLCVNFVLSIIIISSSNNILCQ